MKRNFFLVSLSLLVPVQLFVFDFAARTSLKQVAAQEVTRLSNLEYVPPIKRIQREQRNKSSPIRCGIDPEGTITLLAPPDHIATTTSSRPTFFWYVGINAPILVRFVLAEPKQGKKIIDTRIRADKSGLFQFTIGSEIPELEIGKEYRWIVSLIRNTKRPSANPYAFAWVKRVHLPPELKQKLAAVKGKFDRSSVYANSGLWYDTLSTIYRVSSNQKNLQPQQLLEQINSGKSIWLVNQLPVASYINASKDDSIIVRGTGCY